MAGRTRVRRVGNEPRGWSRCGTAFRWIFLPVALYRRLPADPGVLPQRLWRTPSTAVRLVISRDALGLRHVHAGAPAVRARGRNDRGADARALPRLHHLFVARDERRAHAVRDDLRRADAGVGDVGLRDPIAELDANVGMADVRSLRRILDDHQADQHHPSCRPRAVRRDGTARAPRFSESPQSGDRDSNRFRDSGRVAVASERDQSRERIRERLRLVGARGLWRRRQDVQRRVPVRPHDAAKSARQRARVRHNDARAGRNARRSRRLAILPIPIRGGGVRDCRLHRDPWRARKNHGTPPDVVRARIPRRTDRALLFLPVHRRGLHPAGRVRTVHRGRRGRGGRRIDGCATCSETEIEAPVSSQPRRA